MDTKLRQLYDAIRDYREPKANRQLALIFMKLPSKNVTKFNLQKKKIQQILLTQINKIKIWFISI